MKEELPDRRVARTWQDTYIDELLGENGTLKTRIDHLETRLGWLLETMLEIKQTIKEAEDSDDQSIKDDYMDFL